MKYFERLQLFLLIFILLFSSKVILPQAGELDATFGEGGIVSTVISVRSFFGQSNSTVIQDDGKIVAAGRSQSDVTSNVDFAIVRYNTNGTLDYTFGTNGIVTTSVGNSDDAANSVAIQDDGKIIAAGYSDNGSDHDIAIVRYNTDGSLDTTFGTNGIVITNIIYEDANAVAIQGDGKIVVAGTNNNNFVIVRYNIDGTLDTAFGTNGIVIPDLGFFSSHARSVAIQNDEKIVVAGDYGSGGEYDFAIVRFNPNGSLDNTFGTDGITTTQIGTSTDRAYSLMIQSDGKIVAAGQSDNGSDLDFAIVRYDTSGALDNSFGTNGVVTTQVGTSNGFAHSVAIQSDGKIVATGSSNNGSNEDFALVRYNNDGTLDNTFGTNGIVTNQIGSSHDYAFSVAIQSDGKIVATGSSIIGSNTNFAIVRYNTDGTLNNTFGTNGTTTTPIGTSSDIANSVAIQNDGKIVVAGTSNNGSDADFAITRYNTDGSLDTTFGTGGIVTTDIGIGNNVAFSVAIQSDGKIVVTGYSSNGVDTDIAIARYNTDGSLDNTFGYGDGFEFTYVGASDDIAYSVAIQSDGKLVVAGYADGGGGNVDIILVRYNADGSIDNTFDTDGIVTTSIGTLDDLAFSVAIQNDGKIVVAGHSWNGSDYDFALLRYNTDGSLDNTFDTDGIVTTQLGTFDDFALSMAIQSDGNIIVAGNSWNGSDEDFAIVRYNTNGTLDYTFGTNGIVTTPIGVSGDYGNSVAIQSGGKLVVAGYSDSDFAIVRYNTDGSLDNTFGTNGIVTTEIGISTSRGRSVTIQGDGKIVAAGNSSSGSNYSVFTLARYNEMIIPVELISFTALVSGKTITLNWVTATEANNLGFEIERASSSTTPGQDWTKIGFVEGNGTTTEIQTYSFIDDNINVGSYTYKLKQVDFDGSFEYSNIIEVNVDIPNRFSLSQNYPNPFNPTTNFEFRIADLGMVTLKIYDVLGKEVATLVNEEKPAGVYKVNFSAEGGSASGGDAYNLSSGVYFYRLRAGEFVQTKKMILLR